MEEKTPTKKLLFFCPLRFGEKGKSSWVGIVGSPLVRNASVENQQLVKAGRDRLHEVGEVQARLRGIANHTHTGKRKGEERKIKENLGASNLI